MTFKNFYFLFAAVAIISLLSSCEKDEDETTVSSNGSVKFEITDAPIDDASVEAVFVTVADIKVDGQSVSGFSKTTIDLMAYQNGATKLLADVDMEANAYSSVTLVLDYEQDATGSAPGCYVKKTDESKHALVSSSSDVELDYDFTVSEEAESNIVMDFDLRKCIKRQEGSDDDEFEFVTNAEMKSGIRVLNKSTAGVIKGSCEGVSESSSTTEKVVVYVYEKGTFDRSTEINGQGSSEVEFSNAVSSSTLDAEGEFEIHFLSPQDYELHYASYQANESGQMELNGTLTVDVIGTLNLSSITVDASTTVTANATVTGILGIN